jgi:hypothetical protein
LIRHEYLKLVHESEMARIITIAAVLCPCFAAIRLVVLALPLR